MSVLAAWDTGLLRRTPHFAVGGRAGPWWGPFALFGLTSLPTFLAFMLAGRSPLDALPVYLSIAGLSAVGLWAGQVADFTRLQALARVEQLEELAYRDPLTGAFNRRRFDDDLSGLHPPAFLLLLDLDHFKRINDTYSHDAGDQTLAVTAQVLQELVRPTDHVYRMGGEEFAVLLAPCEPAAALEVANRVCRGVARDVGVRAGLPGVQITVSGGLAPALGPKREVLRTADESLYAAKAAGRNRIHAAAPLNAPAWAAHAPPVQPAPSSTPADPGR
ncbi:GGDEF domain-containing protein [Deinococcus taeanensis]|uniref:GGDEF domain-containing protein n=1 Tax=Deinococcus taeanensis TaxID=2737050 RepID=UPI001CDB9D48|nr:GGDEF domain-containing protein [Deinococcus taeanensis]UBV41668.1 GGDEF domain-containing protein [Deinococcus taeanensis]